jgi:hypothetical protein
VKPAPARKSSTRKKASSTISEYIYIYLFIVKIQYLYRALLNELFWGYWSSLWWKPKIYDQTAIVLVHCFLFEDVTFEN